MDPLISVIVPIYCVEKYLQRCIDSLINQTYKNLEIILVDDGSPDNCPKMCDDYAKNDSRVKVIHKKNGGLSDARNAGMTVAAGELISFIDSDDYISNDFFEIMYKTMAAEKSDIVECSVVKFYEDNHFDAYTDDNNLSSFSTVEALSALISEAPFHQHVWNKLYKTEIVRDITFPVGKLNEDEFWTYQAFGNAKKVTKINKTKYFYFQRKDSIMGKKYGIKRLDALEGKANRQKYIVENYPELILQSKINLFGSCIYAYQCTLKYMNIREKRHARKIIKKYKKISLISFKDINSVPKRSRKYFYLANINFYLCCKLKAILNIGF